MGITRIINKVEAAPKEIKRGSGHVKPKPYLGSLSEPGRVRVANWLVFLNINDDVFYDRLKSGEIPKADGTDPRKYWHTTTVRTYLETTKSSGV